MRTGIPLGSSKRYTTRMRVGVPKEIKNHEYRVALTPAAVKTVVSAGHEVLVQTGAGTGCGFSDEAFTASGARIVNSAADAWAADMVVKVKEPQPEEYGFFRSDLTLFTYLHLAADPGLAKALLETEVRAIAYETVQLADGSLPLLRPMSEVAGRMSVQVGATSLQREHGGKGVLLAGVPGTRRGRVVVLGGGVVGSQAIRIAVGLGADVSVLDTSVRRLAELDNEYAGRIEVLYSNEHNLAARVREADLVVGAVLVPGGRAPVLVPATLLEEMEPGSVVVDVAVDQGGVIETARPTTHERPTYIDRGVVHYCVANMPGAVPQTSAIALSNVTAEWVSRIGTLGADAAVRRYPELAKGANCWQGRCVHEAVATSLGHDFVALDTLVGAQTH